MSWLKKIILSFVRKNGREIANRVDETKEIVDSAKNKVDDLREKALRAIGQRYKPEKSKDDRKEEQAGEKISP
jgi:hypothetical protein